MSWQPRRLSHSSRWWLPVLLAVGAGWGAWDLLTPPRPSRADLEELLAETPPLLTGAAAAMEKGWIDAAISPDYLPTPVLWQVCPVGLEGVPPSLRREIQTGLNRGDAGIPLLADLHQENGALWETGLPLGIVLTQKKEINSADQLFRKLLSRSHYLPRIEQALAARIINRADQGPPDEELVPMIYVLHAAGFVGILNNQAEDALWRNLKNPIACEKLIFARRMGVLVEKVEDGFELELPPPGCPQWKVGLSSFDLYNNLIVGYLKVRGFSRPESVRNAEIARSYNDPPEENPLLALLRQESAGLANRPQDEARVWAISNAEKLLRDRLRQRGEEGYPRNPRLALNLAQLMESAVATTPPAALEALLKHRRNLLRIARDQRPQMAGKPDEREFERALARLRLIEASREGQVPEGDVQPALRPEEQPTAELVATAIAGRAGPERQSQRVVGEEDSELRSRLGVRYSRWLSAVRRDAVAAIARRAASQEQKERQHLARVASALLLRGDATPAELVNLRRDLGLTWQIWGFLRSPWVAIILSVLCALACGALGSGLALQLKIRRELFTSFYRLEAQQRLRRSR